MHKIVRLGTTRISKHTVPVFCKITIDDGKLSISGVEGPTKNGGAIGSFGQIVMHRPEIDTPAPGWTQDMLVKFWDIWDRWHLNDMRAGCRHQQDWSDARIPAADLPDNKSNRDERGILAIWIYEKEHKDGLLMKPCPVCGYKYGSAWLREELPADVVSFLKSLPETDITPNWV